MLRIFRPDETVYGEYQVSNPPVTINTPIAEPGIWHFEISSAGMLDDDCSFALVIGAAAPIPGDVNGYGTIEVIDAILTLQVLTDTEPSATIHEEADVNGDGKIGIEDVIYILQEVSCLR